MAKQQLMVIKHPAPRKKDEIPANRGSSRKKWVNLPKKVTLLSIAFFVLFSLLLLVRLYATPRISEFSYQFDGQEVGHGPNPVIIPTQGDFLTITFSVTLPLGYSTSFFVKPDDCLEKVVINGRVVEGAEFQFCDYTVMGRSLDFSGYLRRGSNDVVVRIKDLGGLTGLRLTPDYTDSFFVAIHLALVVTVILYVLALLFLIVHSLQERLMASIFIGGCVLRVLYFLKTPFDVRGHDVGSHLEYIRYVAANWKIPPASEGWEYHQAPLYYYLSAIWARLAQVFGWDESSVSRLIQFQSLLFSLAILGVGWWMATLLFTRKERLMRLLFVGAIAVFPSLIIHAGSFSNNSLSTLFNFLLIALLLRWWRTGKPRDWNWMLLIFALAFVTRVSALLFLPVICLLLLMQRKLRWMTKWRLGALSLLFLLFACGWLPYIRFFVEQNSTNSYTFGSQSMSSGLAVPTTVRALTTFNPVKILETVYNDPWSDNLRRQYFWEYFYKSAFFGEFSYPSSLKTVSIGMLLLSLLLLPYALFGFLRTTYRKFYLFLPILISFLALLGAQVFYRLYAPFSANQDFRFSLALAPVIIIYTLLGISESFVWFRRIGVILAVGFMLCCAVFFGMLFFVA
ncbi:MAG: hypothetical protein WCG83_06050 [Candidatus Peregrinibacteria bacterium]